MAILLPNADFANDSAWTSTGANFYTEIDETIAAADSDSTYIRTSGLDSALVWMGLNPGVDPISSSGHVIRIAARSEVASTIAPLAVILAGSIGSVSAAFQLTTSYVIYEYTLSGAEADSITDYGDLSVQILFTEPSAVAARVTAFELVLPASAKGPIFQRHPSQRALLRR